MTSFVFVQSCSIFCETGHNKWQCNLQSAFESVCSTLFQICSKKSLFTYNTEMELSEMRHDMTSLPPFKQYHIWQQQKLFSSKFGYFLWLIGNQCSTLFTAKTVSLKQTAKYKCCSPNPTPNPKFRFYYIREKIMRKLK